MEKIRVLEESYKVLKSGLRTLGYGLWWIGWNTNLPTGLALHKFSRYRVYNNEKMTKNMNAKQDIELE